MKTIRKTTAVLLALLVLVASAAMFAMSVGAQPMSSTDAVSGTDTVSSSDAAVPAEAEKGFFASLLEGTDFGKLVTKSSEERSANVDASFMIMGQGMLGIFVVMVIIYVIVLILSAATGKKKNDEEQND